MIAHFFMWKMASIKLLFTKKRKVKTLLKNLNSPQLPYWGNTNSSLSIYALSWTYSLLQASWTAYYSSNSTFLNFCFIFYTLPKMLLFLYLPLKMSFILQAHLKNHILHNIFIVPPYSNDLPWHFINMLHVTELSLLCNVVIVNLCNNHDNNNTSHESWDLLKAYYMLVINMYYFYFIDERTEALRD